MDEIVGTFAGDGATWTFRKSVDGRVVVVDFEKRGSEIPRGVYRAHGVVHVSSLTLHWFDSLGDVVIIKGDVEPLVFDGDGVHLELSLDGELLDYALELKTAALVLEGSCRRAQAPENQFDVGVM